jgi:hypothetical protein
MKTKNQLLIITIILLFLLSSFVNAYSSTNLEIYFDFNNLQSTKSVADTLNQKELAFYDNIFIDKNISIINLNNSVIIDNYQTNKPILNLSINITINFWLKINYSDSNTHYFIIYTDNDLTRYFKFFYSSTLGNRIYLCSNNLCNPLTDYKIDKINNSVWNMITLIINNDTMKLYLNKTLFYAKTFASEINTSNNTIQFHSYNMILYLNDLSIWNTELDLISLGFLYNDGKGLNYAETLSSGGGYIAENYSFDGYYHDYCWFYIACHDYNISNEICDDEVYKVCSLNCADTFDTYKSIGEENITSSFSAQCYNNQFYLQYPSYEGINGTILRNLCYGSYLCKEYNISSENPCPLYINGTIPNKISCVQQTGSIVAECFDTYSIYSDLNTYPPNNDYTGHCAECENDCLTENTTSCYDNTKIQKCKKYGSCLKQFTIQTCDLDYYCLLGTCLLNTSYVEPSDEDCIIFCDLTTNSKYWIMLISSVLILLIMTILMATFGDATSGLLVGLIMSMIVSLTLTIIFKLTLLIPILYIIIGGAICVIIIRKIFIG